MQLKELINGISPADKNAAVECAALFDTVAKPVGSLGELEELVARIAAITGSAEVRGLKKGVLVFCADNGVVAQGVTQSGSEVTAAIARSIAGGRASVSVMAKSCGAEVFPIDIGMLSDVPGVLDEKLARGTGDITTGPAMTRETAERAILLGADYVRRLREQGFGMIATGEDGIGNTTTSSAVTAALLGKSAGEVTGRGAGLDSEGLRRKIAAVDRAVAVNNADKNDAVDVLAKLGGLDIAAIAGVFLGGAYYRVPIVMDGFISAAAALAAVRLCAHVREYILPSHVSAEPGVRLLMDELGFKPIIHASMRLGEGTGAVALFPLIDMALTVYNDAARFTDIAVEQYERLT